MSLTAAELDIAIEADLVAKVVAFEVARAKNADCGGGHPRLRLAYFDAWAELAALLHGEPGHEFAGYRLDEAALAIATPDGSWTIPGPP